MGSLDWILAQLNELYIAKHISIPHDEARASFFTGKNTIDGIEEFDDIIGRYYRHQFTTCLSSGGWLSDTDAQGEAKRILENEYSRRGEGYMAAFMDASVGTNGGLHRVLDVMSAHLKKEAVERHIRKVFDEEVKRNSWEDKVDIMRQLFTHLHPEVTRDIDTRNPERYARNYEELIRACIGQFQENASAFRRL